MLQAKYQFGFRNGHSTNLALTDVIDNINMALDNNEYVIGIFCNLQKAVDTVNHKILLRKTGQLWNERYAA